MNEKIILSGFGGQGVMLAGMILAQAGLLEQREVSWLPSYGPEMRGGTANCHVTISDRPIASPVILSANCAIVMNLPSFVRYESQVAPGGVFLINSSLIEKKAKRDDIRVFYLPASELAMELGNKKAANMVMLGAYSRAAGMLKRDVFARALDNMSDKKGDMPTELNLRAFELGSEYICTALRGAKGA